MVRWWSKSCGEKAFNLKGQDPAPTRKRISQSGSGGDGLIPGD